MIKTKDTFCSIAWNHQFIGPDGNIKPCCRYSMPHTLRKPNIKTEKSLQDVFMGDLQNRIRDDLSKGIKHGGCRKCWQEESAGKGLSIRQNYNRDVPLLKELHEDLDEKNPKITWLELSFSNRCNLRCRMCGPVYSTNWYKDWKVVKKYVPTAGNIPMNSPDEDIDRVIARYNTEGLTDMSKLDSVLPNIRHLKMTGGEPFIIPEYKQILQKIVKLGTAGNVYLNYSTNATVKPDKELLELWSHFKEIQIATSIDGVGPVIEYQRFPTKWTVVEQVIKQLMMLSKEMPLTIGTRPTITLMNVLDVPNITNWWADMMNKYYKNNFDENAWLNHTHALVPHHLNLTVLPMWAKDIVQERLLNAPTKKQQASWDYLVKVCYSADNWENQKDKFKDFTTKLDSARGESFADVIPEFKELLK